MTNSRNIPDKNLVMIGGSRVNVFYETPEQFQHLNVRAAPRPAWVEMAVSCYVQSG